jgi:hypothetical protein
VLCLVALPFCLVHRKGSRELKNLECSINFDARGVGSCPEKARGLLLCCNVAHGFLLVLGFCCGAHGVSSVFWVFAGFFFVYCFSCFGLLCIFHVYLGALCAFFFNDISLITY